MAVRPTVRLLHAGIVSKQLNISSTFLTVGSHTILVFPYQIFLALFWRGPLTGASNAGGMKKSRFSTNISLYLGNDTRQGHSYYGMRIGNRTQAFEWYDFNDPEWFLLLFSRSRHYFDAEYLTNGTRYRHLHWNTNMDLHTPYTRVSLGNTLNNLKWF